MNASDRLLLNVLAPAFLWAGKQVERLVFLAVFTFPIWAFTLVWWST